MLNHLLILERAALWTVSCARVRLEDTLMGRRPSARLTRES